MSLLIGLEVLIKHPEKTKGWGRCGLLSNQASLTRSFEPSWQILKNILQNRLTTLFGPQHGFEAVQQDNMIETGHGIHLPSGLPVFSLYSETREPTLDMVKDIDTIVIDIQIVGCRVYTFKYSIAACLRAAKKYHKKVVILDRPNPLGGVMIEGRILAENAKSFVGEYPLPMRHGLTAGEAARYFNEEIGCDLEIIELDSWNPNHYWHELNRHWIITSPNLPTIDPVYVYPGTVMFEGTNVSEGRGTGLPFQFVGAPFIKDPAKLIELVKRHYIGTDGLFLRPAGFKPTSQKWKDETCQGLQIHVLDVNKVRSYDLGLALIRAFHELSEGKFRWKEPGYEYNFKDNPIDLILGWQGSAGACLSGSFSVKDECWSMGVDNYIGTIQPYLIYNRRMVRNHAQ